MNLFKSFTLTWRQASAYKLGMLALGITVGAYWHELLAPYLVATLALAVILLAYITYVWARQ